MRFPEPQKAFLETPVLFRVINLPVRLGSALSSLLVDN